MAVSGLQDEARTLATKQLECIDVLHPEPDAGVRDFDLFDSIAGLLEGNDRVAVSVCVRDEVRIGIVGEQSHGGLTKVLGSGPFDSGSETRQRSLISRKEKLCAKLSNPVGELVSGTDELFANPFDAVDRRVRWLR